MTTTTATAAAPVINAARILCVAKNVAARRGRLRAGATESDASGELAGGGASVATTKLPTVDPRLSENGVLENREWSFG